MPKPIDEAEVGKDRRLRQVYHVRDLVTLSVSSVGPLFSVAATGGVMAAQAGWWTLPAVGIIAVPFIISGFVFRLLNRHFPHSGASYHWSARVIGKGSSRFQAWILILAYFASIPPIIVPAASYTLSLVAPHASPSPLIEVLVGLFWVLFALIPLLGGGLPTARITQIFLGLEIVSLLFLGVYGVMNFSRLHVPIHFGPVPIAGMLTVAVVAATILDGWEIDSYASEESQRPKDDPGKGGIIGAFMALMFYAILYPLMFSETPMSKLANATNPLAVWGDRLLPQAPWVILIPVLGSTAGGLWLTSYILTRALYAMGREGLIPKAFGKVSSRRVPHVAILVTMGAAFIVTVMQLLFSSLASFFGLVLSAAGFFLVAEFLLDSITAFVFLTVGHRKLPEVTINPHRHKMLLIGSGLSTAMFGFFAVAFFVVGPSAIGSSIDYVLLALIGLGVVFAYLTRNRKTTFIFHGLDAPIEDIKFRGGKRAKTLAKSNSTL